MSDACERLHQILVDRPRFKAGFDVQKIPQNGLYFLFEHGEHAHGTERIVRIGTHSGQNNLAKRIREHLFTPNKDRSIFRKHIGRSLLSHANDPFLEQWELDLTTKKVRETAKIDTDHLKKTEESVSLYMTRSFSFSVIDVANKIERLEIEKSLLSTVAQCTGCRPSKNWLGLHHPNPAIRDHGLWNIQGLNDLPFDEKDISGLFM